MSSLVVHVLTFDGCPHADQAWAVAREAVAGCGADIELVAVDLMDPTIPAEYRDYPSPTILVGMNDVSSNERGSGASCRVGGAPSVAEVRIALRAALD